MKMQNSENKGGWKAPEPGQYVARCVRCIDLGTHETEWQGEKKKSHKFLLSFELPTEIVEFNGEKKPAMVSKQYTASNHEKATIMIDVAAWRGRAMSEAEMKSFQPASLLGKIGLVNLVKSADGQYTNIKNITPLPKGMECPPAVTEELTFDLDEPDWSAFLKCGRGTRIKIASSFEFEAIEPPAEVVKQLQEDAQHGR